MEYIVKYDNRKLYSKLESKYVDLGYIEDLVKAEEENKISFKVVRYKKGLNLESMQDITIPTLKEVIANSKENKSRNSYTKVIKGN